MKFEKKHGHTKDARGKRTPTYNSWRAMKQRCTQSTHDNYEYYGGRGVTFQSDWDNFENFLRDMGERPVGMTLDRINPEGNYEAHNCKWATGQEQARNKRCKKDSK